MEELVNNKTKVLVAFAFIVAAFYTLETTLTLVNHGVVGPVFIKAGIVVACLYYAITKITKNKAAGSQVAKHNKT